MALKFLLCFILVQCVTLAMGQVQEIRLTMCLGLGYTHTALPNSFGHETQEQIAADIAMYQNATSVATPCTHDFRRYLCSLHLPLCRTSTCEDMVQIPCKSLCLSAQTSCEPYLNSLGLTWPKRLDCSKIWFNYDCLPPIENVTQVEPQPKTSVIVKPLQPVRIAPIDKLNNEKFITKLGAIEQNQNAFRRRKPTTTNEANEEDLLANTTTAAAATEATSNGTAAENVVESANVTDSTMVLTSQEQNVEQSAKSNDTQTVETKEAEELSKMVSVEEDTLKTGQNLDAKNVEKLEPSEEARLLRNEHLKMTALRMMDKMRDIIFELENMLLTA